MTESWYLSAGQSLFQKDIQGSVINAGSISDISGAPWLHYLCGNLVLEGIDNPLCAKHAHEDACKNTLGSTLFELHCAQSSWWTRLLFLMALSSQDTPVLPNGFLEIEKGPPGLEAWLYTSWIANPSIARHKEAPGVTQQARQTPTWHAEEQRGAKNAKHLNQKLQERRFQKESMTVQVPDTPKTKFQEHATNKHVMILSCRVFHMALPSSSWPLAAPSLDHHHTLVQIKCMTFQDIPKHSKTSQNVPRHPFFSVLRLCGSRQVVAPCRADERITQMHSLYPSLGVQKWSKITTKWCQFQNEKPTKTQQKPNTHNPHPKTTPNKNKTQKGTWHDGSKRQWHQVLLN